MSFGLETLGSIADGISSLFGGGGVSGSAGIGPFASGDDYGGILGGNGIGPFANGNDYSSVLLHPSSTMDTPFSLGGFLSGGKDLLGGLESLSIPALMGYSTLTQGNNQDALLEFEKQKQMDSISMFNDKLAADKAIAEMMTGATLKSAKIALKGKREELLQNAYHNLANAAFTGGTNEAQALQTIGQIGQNAAIGAKR